MDLEALKATARDENVSKEEIVTLIEQAATERVADLAKFLLVCGLFLFVVALVVCSAMMGL